MASFGFNTAFVLKRQLLAAPCRTTTWRLYDATRSRLLSSTASRLHAAAKSATKTIKPVAQAAAKAAPKTAPKAAAPRAVPAAGSIAPSRYAFIKSLGTKSTPTILYDAPSQFWFYFGCWSSGLSILAWTALTGPTVVKQPDDIPAFVGYVFGASYVLLGAMAFYLISKTPNVVRSIRLIPAAASTTGTAPQTAAKTATAAAAPVSASVGGAMPQIEVTVNRMLPVLQPKVLTTSLESVALKSRFSLPDEFVPELRRLEQQRAEEKARESLRKWDMQHLLTMPFRRFARALSGFFQGVRAAWTDMGFATIRVDGKEYKVDVTKGFAHDGFRTLERLVPVGYP